MRWLQRAGLFAGLLLASSAWAQDAYAPYVSTPYIGLRYRDSTLNSRQFDNSGRANTLRLQLGYLWAVTPNLAIYAEGTRVWSLFGHEYNDNTGRYTSYPAEADPMSTEISNLWVGYKNQWFGVRVGRQYLQLDDERFISINGWRQNPQSFDGVTSYVNITRSTQLSLDWLDQVNRTVGADFPDINQRRWHLDARLLHLDQALPLGKLTAYAYYIRNATVPADSERTVGLRWRGKQNIAQGISQIGWRLETAHQDSYANNPKHFNLPYHLAELSYGIPVISAKVGEEFLGGNGKQAVNVAYGTGHGFDGWVGVFSVPANGLRDRYAGLFGQLPWWQALWQINYHRFDSTRGDQHYGNELDIGVSAKVNQRLTLEVQYGDYYARSYVVDQHKLWLIADFKFGKQAK